MKNKKLFKQKSKKRKKTLRPKKLRRIKILKKSRKLKKPLRTENHPVDVTTINCQNEFEKKLKFKSFQGNDYKIEKNDKIEDTPTLDELSAKTNQVNNNLNNDKEKFDTVRPEISFDLPEEEIENLLQDDQETERLNNHQELYQILLRHLPDNEPIVTSNPPSNSNHVINNIRNRHQISPFVLNLEDLARQKLDRTRRRTLASEKIYRHFSTLPTAEEQVEYFQTINPIKPITVKIPEKIIADQFQPSRIFIIQRSLKPLIFFAAICLAIILPIKGFSYYKNLVQSKDKIMATSQVALEDLKIASLALVDNNLTASKAKFTDAKLSFEQASAELNNINIFISKILRILPVSGEYLIYAKKLTNCGAKIADVGQKINQILNEFYKKDKASVTEKLEILQTALLELNPQITEIAKDLNQIDSKILPEDNQDEFDAVKIKISQIAKALDDYQNFNNYLIQMLGHHYKRRYLVVFQNNHELRASGGFIGSLALVDIYNGRIEKIDIPSGGSYDFQGSLKVNLKAPYPLQLINPRWELQDANWFFDFPTSAKKIQWFYEKSGGPSVDGVIAINASLIEKMLKNTTPIYLPQYGKTITSENFIIETQKAVELEYDKVANRPKQFLSDLGPIFLTQILDSQKTDLFGLIKTLKSGFEEKDIQIYFNNSNWQNQIKNYDWTGEIKHSTKDYLAVVNTNIGGAKTDAKITQQINHEIEITVDGLIFDTLTITRTHSGQIGDPFYGVNNINFLRIFVPQGSKLIESSGFNPVDIENFKNLPDYLIDDSDLINIEKNKRVDEATGTLIYDELDKTVFANWVQTPPQKTSTVKIKYQLPYKITYPKQKLINRLFKKTKINQYFSVFYQKQSGAPNTIVTSTIKLPNGYKLKQTYPADKNYENSFSNNFNFSQDTLIGIIFEMPIKK